jgi:hypothetical protein
MRSLPQKKQWPAKRLERVELRLQSLFAQPRAKRLKPQLQTALACTFLAFWRVIEKKSYRNLLP